MARMTAAGRNRLQFLLVIALFAALGFFAWKSGRRVYDEGPGLTIIEEEDGLRLLWRGPVEAPMAARFEEAFAAHASADRFLIELDSPGGSLGEGRLVIAEIDKAKRQRAVDTRVRSGAYCLSMCVPIFLTGETRLAGRHARFMFHEPSTYDVVTEERVKRPGFEQRMASDWFFETYFNTPSIDPEWREKLRKDWRGRDVWFTGAELVAQQSGIVTALD